jgi:hypothetical protein
MTSVVAISNRPKSIHICFEDFVVVFGLGMLFADPSLSDGKGSGGFVNFMVGLETIARAS